MIVTLVDIYPMHRPRLGNFSVDLVAVVERCAAPLDAMMHSQEATEAILSSAKGNG
jgi:hypothetical protein